MKNSTLSFLAAGALCLASGCQVATNKSIESSVKMKKTPFKISNVSYSANKITKTMYIPYLADDFQFGTGMTDPIWKKAFRATDFEPYKKKTLDKGSEFSVFRTRDHIVLGFFFYEDKENIKMQPSVNSSCWSGDLAELHFGAMEPDPWLLQLAVGVRGNRFDSTGNYNSWKSKVFVNDKGWGAELMFDNSMFKLCEGGFRFNLCRQASNRKEFSTWSKLIMRFHEVENFGELITVDYPTAFRMRFGIDAGENMSRDEFEKLSAKYQIHATKVIHGPYLSCIGNDNVSIAWGTAGKVPSFVKYREKGSADAPKAAVSGKAHAILGHNTEHFVKIDGLTPGKEYEYEIFVMAPVTLKPVSTGVKRCFRLPEANNVNFSFIATNDIHSDVKFLSAACKTPAAKKAAFHIVIGDLLSHAAGPGALYSGIVDPMVAEEHKQPYDRPLLFARGNHEEWGAYASDYFKLFKQANGKTYYSFNYGNVCFIVLDTGNDFIDPKGNLFYSTKDMLAEQKAFLKELAASDEYKNAKYRIVFQHIPPLSKRWDFYAQFHDLLSPLVDSGIGPDAVICGHLHQYIRQDANAEKFDEKSSASWLKAKKPLTVIPYHMIVNSTNAVLEGTVSPEKLEIRIWEPVKGGKDQKLFDTISIKAKK